MNKHYTISISAPVSGTAYTNVEVDAASEKEAFQLAI